MVPVTIIVPTYNEAENIPYLVDRIRKSLDGTVKYDILIMDDSVSDETVKVSRLHGCKTVHRTSNKGLSPAVVEGIDIATLQGAEYIIVMDADLQHPPEVLPRLLEALKEHDFVIPSRYIKGGGCVEWDMDRKFISRVANLAAMPLVMFRVRDLASGFFGFRTSALKTTENLTAQGFKIMLELLVKNNWSSIKEIPYMFESRTRGESKLDRAKIFAYLKQLVNLYLHKFRWLRFGLVGLVGTSIGYPILYSLTEFAGLHYLVSAVCSILVASTSNYFLNNRWTFREKRRSGFLGHVKGWLNYQVLSSIGDGAYLGLMAFLTEVGGMWYMFSAVVSLAVIFVFKFVFANKVIWRTKRA